MSFLLKLQQHLSASLLGRASSLEAISDRTYEICASEQQSVPPAIYLQRDLDRVTGVEFYTNMGQEMRRIQGGQQVHEATTGYEISDVALSRGFLFKAGWKHRVVERAPASKATTEIHEHGTLTGTFFGARYFGHWMTDDLTLDMAAEQTGEPFIPERKPYKHEPEYRRIFNLNPRVLSRARFKKLTILHDIGQNSYKRARYQELRRRLMAGSRPSAGRRIYLLRGASGSSRLLENEEELTRLLAANGFTVLDTSALSANEIAEQAAGAEMIIGVEGSQLGHAVHTIAEHGALCALQHPARFNNIFKGPADCIGFHYAFMTGIPVGDGFRIDLAEMQELVDRLQDILAR